MASTGTTQNSSVRPELDEGQAPLHAHIQYNPDVLSCLANLSNDEVFTPPDLVNKMLDLLPAELWQNQQAKFLDPVTKSGVFLREIAKRLNEGLKDQIPDQQTRINHIFSQQLYGIAITELTSLLARRSVYCSKTANGQYSICDSFINTQGNIRYQAIKHSWVSGKCKFCGASEEVYARDESLESHAYEFIHTDNPSSIFGKDMKFDVIIGNPPYQMTDGGHGTSAKPIYQNFVLQAKKLNPNYLVMVIPSRWFAGGKGLDDFRDEMLNDKRLKHITDFFDSTICFPGVDISGGICYFLWDKTHNSDCLIESISKDITSVMTRALLEQNIDVFLRFNQSIPILRKLQVLKESSFAEIVSSRKPFGFGTNDFKLLKKKTADGIKIFAYPADGFVEKATISRNVDALKRFKIYVSKAYGERGAFPYLVIAKPFIGEPDSCCSETYLMVGPFSNKNMTENALSYMKTRFFRFLVLQIKNTQDATKKVYSLVPQQNFNEAWTDEKLYAKYGLIQEEIDFIESMIRPMELGDE